jgi:hypothetical protein
MKGLFTPEDVNESISNCNFNIALEPDSFFATVMNSRETREAVGICIISWLNTGSIIEYLSQGRLILFNKVHLDESLGERNQTYSSYLTLALGNIKLF